ncbi:hypothetical protein B0H16DRAFT_1462793 [Mycena metata]|uniref:Uncharacterized protein n=1 Tax=Mycena metata TaxID=1033252 RepID=A0AAD7N4J0_9AGAR|nr:hypothetical protein B0H16DRAFT_1462793 [Mycena metata]
MANSFLAPQILYLPDPLTAVYDTGPHSTTLYRRTRLQGENYPLFFIELPGTTPDALVTESVRSETWSAFVTDLATDEVMPMPEAFVVKRISVGEERYAKFERLAFQLTVRDERSEGTIQWPIRDLQVGVRNADEEITKTAMLLDGSRRNSAPRGAGGWRVVGARCGAHISVGKTDRIESSFLKVIVFESSFLWDNKTVVAQEKRRQIAPAPPRVMVSTNKSLQTALALPCKRIAKKRRRNTQERNAPKKKSAGPKLPMPMVERTQLATNQLNEKTSMGRTRRQEKKRKILGRREGTRTRSSPPPAINIQRERARTHTRPPPPWPAVNISVYASKGGMEAPTHLPRRRLTSKGSERGPTHASTSALAGPQKWFRTAAPQVHSRHGVLRRRVEVRQIEVPVLLRVQDHTTAGTRTSASSRTTRFHHASTLYARRTHVLLHMRIDAFVHSGAAPEVSRRQGRVDVHWNRVPMFASRPKHPRRRDETRDPANERTNTAPRLRQAGSVLPGIPPPPPPARAQHEHHHRVSQDQYECKKHEESNEDWREWGGRTSTDSHSVDRAFGPRGRDDHRPIFELWTVRDGKNTAVNRQITGRKHHATNQFSEHRINVHEVK